jgi:hypothetical protein
MMYALCFIRHGSKLDLQCLDTSLDKLCALFRLQNESKLMS